MGTTDVYRETRLRLIDLAREAGDGGATVPACPDWTVRDLLAHVTGVSADALAGNIADAGQDRWTAQQVGARQDRSLSEIVDEWSELGPKLEELLGADGAPAQLVFDTVTHEHDLRHALGRPGERDNVAVAVGLGFVVDSFDLVTAGNSAPPLRMVVGDVDRVVNGAAGAAAATLQAEPFAILRALSGRRTVDEISALDWGGVDPAPWIPSFTFGPFRPRETPLGE